EVSLLSQGRTALGASPDPAHYRPALASSLILLPPPRRRLLRGAFRRRDQRGTGRRRRSDVPYLHRQGAGPASRPVVRRLRRGNAEPPNLTTCLFGPSLSAAWARRTSRSLAALHVC